MNIGLVACVKRKQKGVHAARDLYRSTLFRYAFGYASKHCDRVYILSAKYGLVKPGRRIKNYDLTLKTMSRTRRRKWADSVASQIRREVPRGSTLHFFCGATYREDLETLLSDFTQRVPSQCLLPLGYQNQWYKRHQ
jgi:hypothetical protein